MAVPQSSEDEQSIVEGIVTVRDYGLKCAWQKHMKDTEEYNPGWLSSGTFREPSGLPQSDSSSSPDNLDGFHNQWSDKVSCIGYLRNILKMNVESGHWGRKGQYDFLPLDKLLFLLRKPIVKRAFEELFSGDEVPVDQMVNEIGYEKSEHSRLMILATLISYNDGMGLLKSFIRNEIYDTDLPLRRSGPRTPGMTFLFHKNGDRENSPTMNHPADDHSSHNFDLFCLGQYRYIIPFFDMSPGPVRFYKFDDPNIRLPFTEEYKPTFGGYGTVRRVSIHPAHHNYEPLDGNSEFAVKEISANYKWCRDEIRALERFSGKRSGHDHLIRLLMILQHDDKYYLVFPLAHGNLVDLWEQKQMSPTTPQHVEWVLDQCLGITEGLLKIHHYSSWTDNQICTDEKLTLDNNRNRGRHGDIKPQNILFFSTPGGNYRLVITDFGLTRFHSALSVSNIAAHRVGGLSRTYRPPEFDLNSSISQAYDMWSLGCVFLEFISWFLVGHDDTRTVFNRERLADDLSSHDVPEDKFFNITDRFPVVKPSVKDWIDKLRTHDICPTAIKDFLDIVENGLLQPNPKDRWNINTCYDRLKDICHHYKETLNEPRNSNARSTLPVFNEEYHVVGQLRGPLRETHDQTRIEWQRKILDQVNIRREARNIRYESLNDIDIGTVERNHWTSPNEVSEETGLVGQDTAKTSGQPVEEEMVNQDKRSDPEINPSPLRSVGEVLKGGYARLKGILRRATCIQVS